MSAQQFNHILQKLIADHKEEQHKSSKKILAIKHLDYLRIFEDWMEDSPNGLIQSYRFEKIKTFKKVLKKNGIKDVFLKNVNIELLQKYPVAEFITGLDINSTGIDINCPGIFSLGNLFVFVDAHLNGQYVVPKIQSKNSKITIIPKIELGMVIKPGDIFHLKPGGRLCYSPNTSLLGGPSISDCQWTPLKEVRNHLQDGMDRKGEAEKVSNSFVGDLLKLCPQLKFLNIEINNEDDLEILKLFNSDKKIEAETLDLANKMWQVPEKVINLLKIVKETQLKHLDLSGSKLGLCVPVNKEVVFDESLDLQIQSSKMQQTDWIYMGKERLLAIAEAFAGTPITHLNLTRCLVPFCLPFNEGLVLQFIETVLNRTTLKSLDLSENCLCRCLSWRGIKYLAGIINSSGIEELNLSHNFNNANQFSLVLRAFSEDAAKHSTKLKNLKLIVRGMKEWDDSAEEWVESYNRTFRQIRTKGMQKARETITETLNCGIDGRDLATPAFIPLVLQYANLGRKKIDSKKLAINSLITDLRI